MLGGERSIVFVSSFQCCRHHHSISNAIKSPAFLPIARLQPTRGLHVRSQSSPPNTNITRALPKPHLILTHKRSSANQPPPTTSSSTLTLAPLPRTRNPTNTSIPRRPGRNTSRSGSSSMWARSARTRAPNLPLPCSSHRSSIRGATFSLAGTAIPSTGAESLLQSSDSLAEGVVLGFDELHLAPVACGIGVMLHGGVDALARALGGCGR